MHGVRNSAFPALVSLGPEAEACEGLRRMKLAPCIACILALLQPLKLLPAPPWPHMGSQWADPATLLRSQPQRAKCHGWAPASHFVCRHSVLQAPALVKGDRETGSLPGGSSSASMDFLLGCAGLRVCCSLLPPSLSQQHPDLTVSGQQT